MDAFEKWADNYAPRSRVESEDAFRAGMRAAAEIADAENKAMENAGLLHDENSESRDRCFSRARTAQTIKRAILAEADK